MSTVRESIDVAVPVRVAYERLCHFEDYPQFMSGVQQVTRLSENMAHWVIDLGGRQTEFNARITERRPGELLAWQAVDGPPLTEKVIFEELSDHQCRIIAELDIDIKQFTPDDPAGTESLNTRLRADLSGLKEYVEQSVPFAASGSGVTADYDDDGPGSAAAADRGTSTATSPRAAGGRYDPLLGDLGYGAEYDEDY